MTFDKETEFYIKQLEDENKRLKDANKSLRNNNKGMLRGLSKLQSELHRYKKMYGPLETTT